MMRNYKSISVVFVVVLIAFSCRERYFPDLEGRPSSHLVVEGVLNIGGPTFIRLSRTTQLDTAFLRPEPGAQLVVEGKDNSTRTLIHQGSGTYYSFNLDLAFNQEYRLRIHTSNGGEYLSEYVMAMNTPEIDSITWQLRNDGLQWYAHTHDASNKSRYYRWEFDETWEIESFFPPLYVYDPAIEDVRQRMFPEENVHVGWKFANSTSIIIGSSANLLNDVISYAPLTLIPYGNEKPAVRYSMLLRQYTIDKKGYEFYQLMKKNTESLGTIFDAQPTEITGNITNINSPLEPVIGYISASSVKQRRVFVTKHELGGWSFPQGCISFDVKNVSDSIRHYFALGPYQPIDANTAGLGGSVITSYKASTGICVDVTKRGATLVRPSYW